MPLSKTRLAKCQRDGCKKLVTKARNHYCSPECGQADSKKEAPALVDSVVTKGDSREVTKRTTVQIRTLAQLIEACEIDTNEWAVDRWVCNKWEMGYGSGITVPLFQVKVWLERKVALMATRDELASLVADAQKQMPRAVRVKAAAGKGNMLEVMIPDLHLGKLAWAEETGWDHYDNKIAEKIHDDALEALIARTASHAFDEVVLVVGNDLLHSDTKQGTTTAGTQLDTDSRYHKSFRTARRMTARAIIRLKSVARVVRVLVIPGNHDTLSAWHLGDSLECQFENDSHVIIDNGPTMRKYVQFGRVMLMFTHGNMGKLADYPILMATEQPGMFGETWHREAHTGDKHQLRVHEIKGVRVRIFPALCAPDAWHSEHMFVGNQRSAEAFVWHKEEGLISTAIYTLAAPRDTKPLSKVA